MHARPKLVVVAAASMMIGVVGGSFLHAQTAVPPAYLIAHVQVSDPDGWKQYVAALPATQAPYHVRTLARAPAVPVARRSTFCTLPSMFRSSTEEKNHSCLAASRMVLCSIWMLCAG